jgi:hypothetical protein
MKLRKSLIYLLIFTTVGAFFTYKIVVKAYDGVEDRYNIETLK